MHSRLIYGYLTSNTNTKYKIEHYVQKADLSGYEATPHTTREAEGTTDSTVTASPIPELTQAGYKYNLAYSLSENGNAPSDTAVSGKITADGNMVLKLYYDRVKFRLSYEFEGVIPTGFDVNNKPADEEHEFGTTVAVKPAPSQSTYDSVNYTFIGWYTCRNKL